jgi:hypothetical protein
MANLIGTIGVALLLAAFILNLLHVLRADGFAYSILNLLGAALACYSSWLIDFIPFVVLEGVWAAAAAYALVRRPASPRSG